MRHSDRAVLLALAAGLALLAGCSDDAPTPTIPAGPPPAMTTPPASSYGDQDRNERGNLVKTIGQPGAIQAASGDIALEFRVDAIRQNAECQADGYIDQPENGQFLAVDVFAKSTPAFRTSEQDTEFLNAGYNWSVVTGDGVRHTVDTGPAFGCSPSSRDNLGSLTPSVTVSGTVYLDAPANLQGALLVLSSPVLEGGWEWQIPA